MKSFQWAGGVLCALILAFQGSNALFQPPDATVSRTYLGGESYSEYPPWRAITEGRCQFSFRTSELNGTLLYVDSSGCSGDYLYLRLRNGGIQLQIRVGTAEELQESFGEHLNDNQLHDVTILHNRGEFQVSTDGSIVAMLSSTSPPGAENTLDTTSHVYVGGIPDSYMPDLADVSSERNFVGCVENITFADDSRLPTSLRYRMPTAERNVRVGCAVPCETTDPCNGGTCIPRWPVENVFCDCRNTLQAGTSCSEDPSAYQLTPYQENSNYSCYTIPPDQPFIGEPVSALVHLVPPIPAEGTITTGLSTDSKSFFGVYLIDFRVVYYLLIRNVSEYEIRLDTQLIQTEKYEISLEHSSASVGLRISEVSGSTLTLLEAKFQNMSMLESYDLEFDDICLGGGLLEVVNYEGTFEFAYFRQYTLLEDQSTSGVSRRLVSRSDVINFTDKTDTPSLRFRTYGLGSQRIHFEFRTEVDKSGVLLYSENDEYIFSVLILNEDLVIVSTGEFAVIEICSVRVNDGQWHRVVVEILREGESTSPGVKLTIDGSYECSLTNNSFGQGLQSLESAPLEFGTSLGIGIARAAGALRGCLQNIVFEQGVDIFRPNLEAIARREARFDTTGCFSCDNNTADPCVNGGTCASLGPLQDTACFCPSDFTGSTCEEPATISITPSISTTSPCTEQSSQLSTSLHTPSPSPSPPLSPSPNDQRSELSAAEIGLYAGGAKSKHFLLSEPATISITPSISTTSPCTEQSSQLSTSLHTPSPSPSPPLSPSPNDQRSELSAAEIGLYAGGAVAVLVIILVIVIVVVCVYLIYRSRVNKQGFYETNEGKSARVVMPHYSASLGRVTSQVVSLDEGGTAQRVIDRQREFFI